MRRNEAWVPGLDGNRAVIFTPPTGSRIDPGDRLFVTVPFETAINQRGFPRAAGWEQRSIPVPVPASLACVGAGPPGFGLTHRRRKAAYGPPNARFVAISERVRILYTLQTVGAAASRRCLVRIAAEGSVPRGGRPARDARPPASLPRAPDATPPPGCRPAADVPPLRPGAGSI